MLRSLCLVLVAILSLLVAAPGPAWAQNDNQVLFDRINRLENDLRTLQRRVYQGGPAPQSNVPSMGGSGSLTDATEAETSVANRLNARIDQLEGQLRDLVGRFEEVEYKNIQTQRRMDKLVEDVDFRFNALERAAATPAAAPPATPGTPAAPAVAAAGAAGASSSNPNQAPSKEGVLGALPVDAQGRPLPGTAAAGAAPAARTAAAPAAARSRLPAGTPKERYDFAYKLLVQSEYAEAEAAFKEFIAAHGQDALAGNAQYWVGETYYVRGQYEPAAAAFLQGYQGYPKNAKAPDSLLKLGMSLTALKKTAEACAAFGQLAKEFPTSPPHVKDAMGRERAKAGCR
ncbi:tol-pal system protein YbgF [Ferrovibrio sp.]|uniref:tol-pal system protein YbgF n=1 Tax=Ferrovibrio sp. TaxID=1917215 RepID=UPI001B61FD6C|nr:tol-pal system protein YbgF [Ferrovibrio sp.]MBP7066357.1 tol-pal system protein YbgF [Ferrovibrio sp.]